MDGPAGFYRIISLESIISGRTAFVNGIWPDIKTQFGEEKENRQA